jgi:hypothetical protein
MRSFLGKLALLLLPLALACAWLELGLRRMPTAMGVKAAQFAARADSAELLVLGASEAYQGLSPDHLGLPGFNGANVGQDLHYDHALFQLWRPKLPRLKAVLLSVSYTSLEYRLPRSPESWRQFQYAQAWGLAPEDPGLRWDPRRFSALALIEPWPALKAARRGFQGEALNIDKDGWQGLEPVGEEQRDLLVNDLTARKRARYHDGLLDTARDAEGRAQLRSLALAVQTAGARPFFVTLPVTQAYARAIDASRLQRLRSALTALSTELQVPVWDHFDDPHFDDADFADPDHLDRDGALKFCQILKSRLRRALASEPSPRS